MKQPVLIVEDDPDVQAMVSHVVGYLNVAHELVSDAEIAIQKLLEANPPYEAVIIDLALPGKDGWDLLAEIRSTPPLQHLTCIAVTAFHTSKTREETLRAGFDAYFAKPLDAVQFAKDLEKLL